MAIDFTAVTQLPTGVAVINCTAHSIVFLHGEQTIEVPPSGAKADALPKSEAELEEIERAALGVLAIGSMISA